MSDYDVIVVGAGNAALAAAVSARENGADRVVVLEKAPREMRGGNTHWSGGLLRIAFDRVEDLDPLVPDAEERLPGFRAGIEPYTAEDFLEDLLRVTGGRADRELAEIVISNSYDTVRWIKEHAGVPMEPALSLGGIRKGDVIKWPKGAIIRAEHEGVGLSSHWFAAAERDGVEIRYGAAVQELIVDGAGKVAGVRLKDDEGLKALSADAVVLACGGFEANQQWRAQYLGRPWDHAKVRGTRHNQGDGLRMALAIGAMAYGNWSSCHSTPISAEWGDFAPRELTDRSNRLSYPWGVMLNLEGRRFCDEGADFQFFTYAKYGRVILEQPGGKVWQIFDSKTVDLLEPRYETSDPITADSLEALVAKLDFRDPQQALATLTDYNAAAHGADGFDPTERDGLAATGLDPRKSNWAIKLDVPPFVAYSATGGITFTFGGLRIDDKAQVIGVDWRPIEGLYCCGEMVGGLFHDNYPGGTGLVSGAVFGRIAGRNAAVGTNWETGMNRLADKVALVAGAGSVGPGWGNGKATAVLFAHEGARVFAVDVDRQAAEETVRLVEDEGGRALAHAGDVTDADAVAAMVEACLAAFGRIDILVNNVGGSAPGGPVEMSQEVWQRQLETNLGYVFLTCKHVLPVMQRQGAGAIVNLGSIAGLRHFGADVCAYAAAKAGLVQFTRVTAVEYAAKGIRCNTVVPGLMDTPLVASRLAGQRAAGDLEGLRRARNAQPPMGRMGDAWDVAHAALFLASDEARYVTGTEIIVDGGLSATCAR